MKKKIILACSIFNYGGVGKMMNFVASSLTSEERDVCILSLRHETRPSFLPAEIGFQTLKEERFKNSILWRTEEIINLRKFLKKQRPFTICTFGSEPSVMVRMATLGMKNITVVSAERSDPYTLPRMWQKLSSWAYSKSDYCVFQLEKQRDFYKNKIRSKSFVIPNAFVPSAVECKDAEKRKVVISAGRFVYQKGYDTLIKAFANVYKKHQDYSLELYGGGEDQARYYNLID